MDVWPLLDIVYFLGLSAFIVTTYFLWFVPMNRIRTLDEVGFAHLNLPPKVKRQRMKQLKKSKQMGNPPPPFPNGWYVLAESREVNLFLEKQRGHVRVNEKPGLIDGQSITNPFSPLA